MPNAARPVSRNMPSIRWPPMLVGNAMQIQIPSRVKLPIGFPARRDLALKQRDKVGIATRTFAKLAARRFAIGFVRRRNIDGSPKSVRRC